MNDNGPGPTTCPSIMLTPLSHVMLPVEGMVMAVERLRDLARHAGLNRIADSLEDARLEAERQANKARQDDVERYGASAELWRPEEAG